MIVRRRADGIVEIQRATASDEAVSRGVLRVVVLSIAAMIGLAAVLELFPRGVLLAGGLLVLWVLHHRTRARSRPRVDAA